MGQNKKVSLGKREQSCLQVSSASVPMWAQLHSSSVDVSYENSQEYFGAPSGCQASKLLKNKV